MKNNSLKNLIFIFVLSLIMNFKVYGNEIDFSANQISTYEKGNLTIEKEKLKQR